jgi:hypothetical protein
MYEQKEKEEIIELANGEIRLWIEQGTSIHLKSVTAFGDPVELSSEEAIGLSAVLLGQASKLKDTNQLVINVTMTSDDALVLFEFLSRYDQTGELKLVDDSERQTLWNLLCLLEKRLIAPLQPDYEELLRQACEALNHSAGAAR